MQGLTEHGVETHAHTIRTHTRAHTRTHTHTASSTLDPKQLLIHKSSIKASANGQSTLGVTAKPFLGAWEHCLGVPTSPKHNKDPLN